MTGNATANNVLRGRINAIKYINGLSAYEVAVKNGFNGTEQEWILSLIGPSADMTNYYTKDEIDNLLANIRTGGD